MPVNTIDLDDGSARLGSLLGEAIGSGLTALAKEKLRQKQQYQQQEHELVMQEMLMELEHQQRLEEIAYQQCLQEKAYKQQMELEHQQRLEEIAYQQCLQEKAYKQQFEAQNKIITHEERNHHSMNEAKVLDFNEKKILTIFSILFIVGFFLYIIWMHIYSKHDKTN